MRWQIECMTFQLILYSQIQDYCSATETSFIKYILHFLPHHLLQAAVYRGSTNSIQLLLDSGAGVHAQGGGYGNALQAATYCGDIEVIQLLELMFMIRVESMAMHCKLQHVMAILMFVGYC